MKYIKQSWFTLLMAFKVHKFIQHMRLPDSASIFTVEIWANIKALEEIKNASASKFIIFTVSLSCLQALLYMKLEHPLIRIVIR